MMWYLDDYTKTDRQEWNEIVSETLGLWEMDTTQSLSDICWQEANDENVDWLYTANEDLVLAAAVATKDRYRILRENNIDYNDEIEDEKILAELFEVTRQAFHTLLFNDVVRMGETLGYETEYQILDDEGWKPYLDAAGIEKPN